MGVSCFSGDAQHCGFLLLSLFNHKSRYNQTTTPPHQGPIARRLHKWPEPQAGVVDPGLPFRRSSRFLIDQCSTLAVWSSTPCPDSPPLRAARLSSKKAKDGIENSFRGDKAKGRTVTESRAEGLKSTNARTHWKRTDQLTD